MQFPPSLEMVLLTHWLQADWSVFISVPAGQDMQVELLLGTVPGGQSSHSVLFTFATWFEAHAVQFPPSTEMVLLTHWVQPDWSFFISVPAGQDIQIEFLPGTVPGGQSSHSVL